MAHGLSPGRGFGSANDVDCLRLSSCSQREHTAERNKCPQNTPLMDFSLLLICSCCSSVDLQAFPFHRFQPPHPWKPESGSLQNALVVPCSLPKDRAACS